MNATTVPRFWLVLAFFAVYFVWGTTYLANLYALKAIPPFVISALRYLVAGLLLALLAYSKGHAWPQKEEIRDLAISGILMLVGGSGLVVVAEQYITSGSAAVIVATEPLWFVLLDQPRWKLYFSNGKIIAGLLIGFVGVVLFAQMAPANSPHQDQSTNQFLGTVIVLVGAILWVSGTLFAARRIKPGRYNLWHTTIQLGAAGLFATFLALANGEWNRFAWLAVPLPAWGGLAFLILFGSLIAYLAFAWLVTVQPPAIVSTHTYINPLIAVLIGWLAAGEEVTGLQVVALTVVLTGVVLTQLSKIQAGG
ncbi:EamA family transporter [Fibrella sp. HMF5335]|uniref:EamA family transporter n=1 Tax=Fibrella rubiginis TaxID=2817060 RepID=A0A939GKE7_9BACT|nr:EamA family transporter [Fibrella rubiginis]MBO0938430.1 EamA family transporter [Fibrella rubiginis]